METASRAAFLSLTVLLSCLGAATVSAADWPRYRGPKLDGTTHRPTTLTCLDWATGQRRWSEPGFGNGGLMAADGRLIVFDQGQLSLVRAVPDAFHLLARAQVLGGKCWTAPVLAHGKLYGRNAKGDLICLDGVGRSNSALLP